MKNPFILLITLFSFLASDLYSAPENSSFRFLDNLSLAEWVQFSDYNLSPYFAEIYKQNGQIVDEEIDNSSFSYGNDTGGDYCSEHWFYKPKFKVWITDILHPPKGMIVKKDGRPLEYQHDLFKPGTPPDKWDTDEYGIFVSIPDSDETLKPQGRYTVSYLSFIKEDITQLNFKYSNKNIADFARKYLTIANDTRDSLFLPAPSEINFNVPLGVNGILSFSTGVIPGCWFEESDGARFEIYITSKKNKQKKKLFEKDIDPRNVSNHQWYNHSVDLGDYQNEEVKITFETDMKGDKTFDFAAVANTTIFYKSDSFDSNKNVILISLDNLRADHFGCYGYKRNSTPFIDRFSKNSVLFKRCIAPSSWTLPSHMSILTSLTSSEHGVWDRDVIINRNNISIAEILHNEGYLTKAFVTHKFLAPEYGFNKGFQSYVYHQDEKAEIVSRNALEWLTYNHDKKFFLFLHYFDPHFDYNAPKPYYNLFDPHYKGSIIGSLGYLYKYSDPRNPIDPVDLAHLIALYDGEARYVDKAMDTLIDGIRNMDLTKNTMIIITSDHGEEFKDHKSMLHGTTLFEEQLLVPLIINIPNQGNKILENQVESIDIAPTILNYAGIPNVSSFKGQSLFPLINKEKFPGRYQFMPAVSETKRFGPYRVSVTTPDDKYYCIFALSYNEERYFDLYNDPKEMENKYCLENQKAATLRNFLINKIPNYTIERNWFISYFTPSSDEVFEVDITGSSEIKIIKTKNIAEPNDKILDNKNKLTIISKKMNFEKTITFQSEKYNSEMTINLLINGSADGKRVKVGIDSLEQPLPIHIKQDFVSDYRYNLKQNPASLPSGGFILWCETKLKFALSLNKDEKTKEVILDGESMKLLKSLGYIQ